jgi:hypothetical protein
VLFSCFGWRLSRCVAIMFRKLWTFGIVVDIIFLFFGLGYFILP